jgi:hypothetical protein
MATGEYFAANRPQFSESFVFASATKNPPEGLGHLAFHERIICRSSSDHACLGILGIKSLCFWD